MALTTVPLTAETFEDFAALVDAHGGVFGGCWCLGFHDRSLFALPYAEKRERKRQMVIGGRAHAALVYAGGDCVGWCQFGSPEELPQIKNRRNYEASLSGEAVPPWRLTCFFVHRRHRGLGVARAALAGALAEIARQGGGLVEAYPEDVHQARVSPTFLHAGTLALFEAAGFAKVAQIGKNKWVVRRQVAAAGAD